LGNWLKIVVLIVICLIPLFIVPAFALQCPDGAYIGRDNQGNEACRDIKTNQIINPVIAQSPNKANQPSSSNQNPSNNSSQVISDYAPLIIIFLIIPAIIVVVSRQKLSSSKIVHTEPKTKYKKYQRTKSKQVRAGKKGENLVRAKLSQLDNDYHIFWDVNVVMPKYITYNDERNLRTAQIDFVVVSKKGVFVIEVKNWSRGFLNQKKYFSPYEQVDRASRLLWIALKSSSNPRVTGVLLSLGGIMRSDPKYKYVFVSDLDGINDFLQGGNDNLSQQDVDRIRKKMDDFPRS